MPAPRDPIAAVTHPDPYPYYAELVARTPLYHDPGLGLWIASSAAAVTAVLTSELCRVRPPAEPVPVALLGSPAADVFRHLVRMNDGPAHATFKPAVAATLRDLDTRSLTEHARQLAQDLIDETRARTDAARLSDFAFQLPVRVLSAFLGLPPDRAAEVAYWTADFVGGLAAGSAPAQVERAKAAAARLLELVRSVLAERRAGAASALAAHSSRGGRDDTDVVVANAIGFLSQAYEATAGLIGNTLVTLARHDDLRARVAGDPRLLGAVVQEVLRYDPPVQNTRRFVAGAGHVAEQEMKPGDAILVVLAAANRDPAANARPADFDLLRRDRRVFTFGAGAHACPGDALAATIAEAGVGAVLRSSIDLAAVAAHVTYRPSVNTRIPVFAMPVTGRTQT